jgi:hypothetical protein
MPTFAAIAKPEAGLIRALRTVRAFAAWEPKDAPRMPVKKALWLWVATQ